MSNNERRPPPTHNITQVRTPMFLPVKQFKKAVDESVVHTYENNIATIQVSGPRLNQSHRDILDLIFSSYDVVNETGDGSVEYAFSLYDLQKRLGKKTLNNQAWIEQKLNDLQKVKFRMRLKEDAAALKGITFNVNDFHFSVLNDTARSTEHGSGKTGKGLYVVQFNRYYMRFIEADLKVYYDANLLDSLIDVENPQVRAIIRYCLSHGSVKGYKFHEPLKKVFSMIGLVEPFLPLSSISKYKKEILAHTDLLRDTFGIEIKPMKTRSELGVYYQHKDGNGVTFGERDKDIADDFERLMPSRPSYFNEDQIDLFGEDED